MKIAHLFTDTKFITGAFESFESVAPGASKYFFCGKGDLPRSLDQIQAERLYLTRQSKKKLENYDIIIIHGLDRIKMKALRWKNEKQKMIWIGMGFDYYDLIAYSNKELLEAKTNKFLRASLFKKDSFNHVISLRTMKKVLNAIGFGRYLTIKKVKALDKIDIFCPVLNSEYAMIQHKYKPHMPKFVDWNYGVGSTFIIHKLGERLEDRTMEKSILIGNSSTPTNNHVEIVEILSSEASFRDFKVVMPLSYGDKKYRDEILSLGQSRFAKRFHPIVEFKPLEDYFSIIESCTHIVMNHVRQQAGANIVFGLVTGARVIMNHKSPLYKEWINRGALINSTNELALYPEHMSKPLNYDEALHNRRLVSEYFNPSVFINKTRNLLNTVGYFDDCG